MTIVQKIAAAGLVVIAGSVSAQDIELPALGPDDLIFSVKNMDLSVDPRKDFYHFAAGGWLDRVKRPEDKASWTFASIQSERIKAQIEAVVAKAVEEADAAAKGSPAQLVGDFYKAYMDTGRRNAQGIAPLKSELDRIAAISSLDELARYLPHMLKTTGVSPLLGFGPDSDLADNTKYAIYATGGSFGLDSAGLWHPGLYCGRTSAK